MRWELDWLENRARISPSGEALIDAETNTVWDYQELNNRAISMASFLLSEGVTKGDRIALLAPNHISYFDLLFACQKIGAIFVPINWRLSIEEINDIIIDSSPVLIGVHERFQTVISLLSLAVKKFVIGDSDYDVLTSYKMNETVTTTDIRPNEPLLMIYTGGTTGKPKGVVLTHQSVLWNAINTIISWNLTKDDKTFTNIPLFHTGGLNALSLPLLLTGGTVVIADQFDAAKAVQYLQFYHCTIVLFIPTMYHMMIQTEEFQRADFPYMKIFLSGGAPCPLEIYEAFWKKGLLFKEGYGLTEAGPNNFYISPEDAFRKKGSVGKAMMFNNVKIMKSHEEEAKENEVGELWLKGKHCFSHYWNNEEATESAFYDRWLCTGDLAKKDQDGYYYIVGRKKDLIITGGENVYPIEVEQWLLTHPLVNEVAVIGLPDEKWGESVTAFITSKEPEMLKIAELKSYCSFKLGKYKIPKQFFILSELPKTHVGKIDKKVLKEIGIEQWQSQKD
ncbi:AMP-binding protein [Pseudoneobacillus sp. C159]